MLHIMQHARYSRHHGVGDSKEAGKAMPRAPTPEAGTATLIRGEAKVSKPDARCLRGVSPSDLKHVYVQP